jgi:beta-glucosidase
VESGVATVMSAYNSVNGDWCGHSRHLLTEVLKEEWGFDGTVITDFIFGIRDATASLKAGLDIEMPYKMIRWQHMPREIAEGRVTWGEVDATVERILRTLIRFEHLRQQPMPDAAIVAGPAHTDLALQSARQSIVLLENDGVLPLSSTTKKIAVLGRLANIPNLGDGGSSAVNPPYVVTPLDGITRGFPQAQVTHSEDDATTAKGADLAIIVVGTTMHDEGEFLDLDAQLPMLDLYAPPFETDDQRQRFRFLIENQDTALAEPPGGDRASLKLSAHDQQLILDAAASGVPVVVVMMGGSAFVTEGWRDRVSAILHLWYPGMEGGTAIADVLAGQVNPSGHMPFATPVDEGLLPQFALLTDHADYGLMHGQWHMDENGQPVRYPFGHGLSYSDFQPLALTVEVEPQAAVARTEWKNTGTIAGDDVIFIFASVPDSAYQRPKRRLVGFQRISMRAGEVATTAIPLDLRQLAIRQDGRWLWEALPLRLEAARWSGDPQAAVWSGTVESPLS